MLPPSVTRRTKMLGGHVGHQPVGRHALVLAEVEEGGEVVVVVAELRCAHIAAVGRHTAVGHGDGDDQYGEEHIGHGAGRRPPRAARAVYRDPAAVLRIPGLLPFLERAPKRDGVCYRLGDGDVEPHAADEHPARPYVRLAVAELAAVPGAHSYAQHPLAGRRGKEVEAERLKHKQEHYAEKPYQESVESSVKRRVDTQNKYVEHAYQRRAHADVEPAGEKAAHRSRLAHAAPPLRRG